MSYSELSVTDRATIQVCLSQGLSLRAIARCLSRYPSTISREIRRNSILGDDYRAERVQASRLKRRRFCRLTRKLTIDSERFRLVKYLLRRYLSPEQMAGKLRHMNLPKLENAYLCRETIYTTIYALPVGQLSKELIHCLRHGKSSRKPRRSETNRRGQISRYGQHSFLSDRGGKAPDTGALGGDLIKGKVNASAVGILVEFNSGYLILTKMHDATATSAIEIFSAALNQMPLAPRKTLTYEQGRKNQWPDSLVPPQGTEPVIDRSG